MRLAMKDLRDVFVCKQCGCLYEMGAGNNKKQECPVCKSKERDPIKGITDPKLYRSLLTYDISSDNNEIPSTSNICYLMNIEGVDSQDELI